MSRYIDANFIFEQGLDEYIKCICCGRAEYGSCDGGCDYDARKYGQRAFEAIENWIKDVPTADVVEVKHGEWDRIDFLIRCNQCNCIVDTRGNEFEFNFCPKCGADMRETED